MKNKIIQAFGFLTSPLMISSALKDLNVSHTLVNGTLKSFGHEVNMGALQPAWPVVLPSIRAINKYHCTVRPQILLVCDAQSRLAETNIKIVKPGDLTQRLRDALEWTMLNQQNSWELTTSEMSVSDYVEIATKPSLLNNMQGLIYKITPYDLRKEVQALLIGYLAGVESRGKLRDKLATSHKLSELAALTQNPKFALLRDAVAMYHKTGLEEKVAAETGFEPFELLYIARSSAKTKGTK